jgi:Alpha/beta hydrolase of unknown function (DUF900)
VAAVLLSVRTAPAGGDVADRVSVVEGTLAHPTRVTLLVHGYNNTQADALASYQAFLAHSGLDGMLAAGQVCEFVWPGDKRWGMASAMAYPLEIAKARESAARLYDFLKGLQTAGGWPLEVQLVCHSLGNRVLLELLERWVDDGSPAALRFTGCSLMAAAVPVPMAEEGGALGAAAAAPGKTLVLHSSADAVLHWAFPPGESAAGEGFFPQAVGRAGEPAARWSERAQMAGYGHGDYWPGTESSKSVLAFLGGAPERALPGAAISEHALPEPGTIAARELPQRNPF